MTRIVAIEPDSKALTPGLLEAYEAMQWDGIEYFKMARDAGAREPEGVMLQTRGGMNVGGHTQREGANAGANALYYLRSRFSDAAAPVSDEITRDREIAAVLIVTDYDTDTQELRLPSEETLQALAAYPGIADGQPVRVMAVHTGHYLDFKL